jgi:acetyltransferase
MMPQDSSSDGLLAILAPQGMTDSTATAQALAQYAKVAGEPILASWIGGEIVELGE